MFFIDDWIIEHLIDNLRWNKCKGEDYYPTFILINHDYSNSVCEDGWKTEQLLTRTDIALTTKLTDFEKEELGYGHTSLPN